MPRGNRIRAAVTLPKGVHRVLSRGREYFYFQEGRGTAFASERIRLPDDPRSPEFWLALRQAQGMSGVPAPDTVGAIIDQYLQDARFLKLAAGTQDQYRRAMTTARKLWSGLQPSGVRPVHVQTLIDAMGDRPGAANNFLGGMRAFSSWARRRDYIAQSIVEGVEGYKKTGGHKPWTPDQITAAHDKLTGVIRRGVLLYMYTGMRGSDAVRLGWTDIDGGGFSYRARKTGRDVYCPIVDELAAEMERWTKRPGPFLLQEGGRADGKPYTRKLFSRHFADARDIIPELAGTTLHGLRCTAVIRLRRAGLASGQIGDIVGMSLAMIERYCRFADRKASGDAALFHLNRTSKERGL